MKVQTHYKDLAPMPTTLVTEASPDVCQLSIGSEFPWVDGKSLCHSLSITSKQLEYMRSRLSEFRYWRRANGGGGRTVSYNRRLIASYLLLGPEHPDHKSLLKRYLEHVNQTINA